MDCLAPGYACAAWIESCPRSPPTAEPRITQNKANFAHKNQGVFLKFEYVPNAVCQYKESAPQEDNPEICHAGYKVSANIRRISRILRHMRPYGQTRYRQDIDQST